MLPKIAVPVVELRIPSLNKTVKFSRFRVAEEKILLMGKESGEISDVLTSIKQVIASCSQDPTLDIEHLATFDIEYLFLKLHAASVSNIVKLSLIDPEDDDKYEFDIDLDKVQMDESHRKDPNIKINDTITIHLNYPPATLYGNKEYSELKNPLPELLLRCMDKITDGQTQYETKSIPRDQLEKWINTIPSSAYDKIKEFFGGAPSMKYELEYKTKKGTERKYELSALSDFFTLV